MAGVLLGCVGAFDARAAPNGIESASTQSCHRMEIVPDIRTEDIESTNALIRVYLWNWADLPMTLKQSVPWLYGLNASNHFEVIVRLDDRTPRDLNLVVWRDGEQLWKVSPSLMKYMITSTPFVETISVAPGTCYGFRLPLARLAPDLFQRSPPSPAEYSIMCELLSPRHGEDPICRSNCLRFRYSAGRIEWRIQTGGSGVASPR